MGTWSLPPELVGSPPRPVHLTRRGILLAVAALVILGGGIALGVKLQSDAAREDLTDQSLRAQGTETEATVTRLWRSGKNRRNYRVGYQFAMNGRIYRGDVLISRQFWAKLSEGSRLRVRYLPFDPGVNRPVEPAQRRSPGWLPWALPAFTALVSLFMGWSLRKQKRLLEDGRAAPGTVTRVSRVKGGYSVAFDFALPGGSQATGRGMRTRVPAEVGGEITVVYDPDNPGNNAPYPFDLVRVADR